MVKVSVITDEISQDFERALDVSLSLGVRHVELRSLWDTNVVTLSDEQVQRAKALIQERDMVVTAIAGPFLKTFLGPEYREMEGDTYGHSAEGTIEEHLAILERCFAVAGQFDTDLIRTFTFWRSGAPTETVYEKIAEQLEVAVRMTEQAGLRLALENEHGCFIGSVGETIHMFRLMSSPTLGLIWDPGNAACLDPADVVLPGGYEKVRDALGLDRIFHIHLKDTVTDGNVTRFTEFGRGELDYRGQLEALVRDGYSGAVSMETHWRGEGLTAEQSTVRCIQNLWNIVDEAGLRAHFS